MKITTAQLKKIANRPVTQGDLRYLNDCLEDKTGPLDVEYVLDVLSDREDEDEDENQAS